MSPKHHTRLFLATLAFATLPALAAPSLYWDHLEGGTISQEDCTRKASTAMTSANAGTLSKDADSVRAWNEHTVAAIECLPKGGDRLLIMILVGSDNAMVGNALFNSLKQGMQP